MNTTADYAERLRAIELELKREFETACREWDLCTRENENEKAAHWLAKAHAHAHILRHGFGLIPSWNKETKTTVYRVHAWKREEAICGN